MSTTFFINPRSNPELSSLYRIAMLPPSDHLEDYFLGAMAILSNHFPVRYAALLLQEPQKDSLHLEAVYGVERNLHPPGCGSRMGIVGKALESKQPLSISDLSQEPLYSEFGKGTKRLERIQAPLLCIPLAAEGEALGVMISDSLYGPRNAFAEDFQFFSILSAILSPVIKNYLVKRGEPSRPPGRTKGKSLRLEEVLGEQLTEVINRVDPYLESRNKMCLFDDIISIVEKILIQAALARVNYVQVAAAQLLGINRNTLRKKIRELKVPCNRSREK